MAEPIPAEEQSNFETFRDCLSEPVLKALAAPIEKPKPKKKRHAKKGSKSGNNEIVKQEVAPTVVETQETDAEDLGEFIEVYHPYKHEHTYPRTLITRRTVPKHPNLPLPPRRTAHAHALHLQRLTDPPRPLHDAPLLLHLHRPPAHHSTHRNRQPRKLRPPPTHLRHHRPTQPPHTAPNNVHLCRHRPAPNMEQHARHRLRALQQRLGALDIPPSHSQSGACARAEAGVAYRG